MKSYFWLAGSVIALISTWVLFLSFMDLSKDTAPRKLSGAAAGLAQPPHKEIYPCSGFDYPVSFNKTVTQPKDGDGWFNAQDFTKNKHLGEDWNAESGGDSDCGQPVFASSSGLVVFSQDIGGLWGNVMIVRHKLPYGSEVETLYGHLEIRFKSVGDTVFRRELIGEIGDGAAPCGDHKPYSAHLHFELRMPGCREWGQPGPGYSADHDGWVDPSEFIDTHRSFGR